MSSLTPVYCDYISKLPQLRELAGRITSDGSLVVTIAFGTGARDPLTVANEVARDRILDEMGHPELWYTDWSGFQHYGCYVATVTVGSAGKLTPMAAVVLGLAEQLANYPCLDDDLLSAAIHYASTQALEGEEFASDAEREAAYDQLGENWGELDADGFSGLDDG